MKATVEHGAGAVGDVVVLEELPLKLEVPRHGELVLVVGGLDVKTVLVAGVRAFALLGAELDRV